MSSFVNSGPRLDRLPMTPYHRRLMWLVGLGMVCDTFNLAMQSAVGSSLLNSHFATFPQVGHFISATFAGMAIGGIMAGFVGDRFGRRFCYQFNLLVFGLASFAAALAPSMGWLIIFRGIIGIGLGAEIVVGYSMVSEFVPPASRGRLIAYIAVGAIGLATPVAYLVAYFVIPNFGWRWMFVLPAVGAMIIWYLRKDMPESPRWLESVGRGEDAEKVLQTMENAAALMGPLPPVLGTGTAPGSALRVPFSVLFSPPVIRRTLLIIIINIAIGLGTYGFGAFVPTFFVKEGMSITKSLTFGLVIACGSFFGTLFCWWLADKIGRRWGIVISTLGAAAIGLVYPLMKSPEYVLAVGFLMFGFLAFQMAMGLTMYAPELFPTEYRLRGNAIGNVSGRVASMLSPFATVPLYTNFGVGGVTISLACFFLIVSLLVAVFGIETSRKPLELIEKEETLAIPVLSQG